MSAHDPDHLRHLLRQTIERLTAMRMELLAVDKILPACKCVNASYQMLDLIDDLIAAVETTDVPLSQRTAELADRLNRFGNSSDHF